ncbi:wiskott-Aldrich syndrome protein family member 1-like [Zingiber officinale]|uniref:wiskott-Aldrich syndrome protein family member 1-like n=1 Tax=Zingiber officinale TaxID=94328 RepID=UPI001C4D6F1A|nr:wiskott-Aldrich syndrome protein family member 1-like [Zingiber officinale]
MDDAGEFCYPHDLGQFFRYLQAGGGGSCFWWLPPPGRNGEKLARGKEAAAARGNGATSFLLGSSPAPTPATGRFIPSSPSPACDISTGATHRRSSSSASRRRHHPPPPPHCEASVLLAMLPSEPPRFAGAAAGRPPHYFLSVPRHTTRQLPAPASISPSSRRRFPSLLSPPAVVTVATVFGVRHHCLWYPASPLPVYTVVTASSDNRCRCRHLQQPPSLLPAGAALRRPPSSSSVAHCSPQQPLLPSPVATAAVGSHQPPPHASTAAVFSRYRHLPGSRSLVLFG